MTAVYGINIWDETKRKLLWSIGHSDDQRTCWASTAVGDLWRRICVVCGHSPVDIDSHKLKRWKVVHLRVLTCSYWWTTFQLLNLWLSNVDGTVTSNDTCVVIIAPYDPVGFTTLQSLHHMLSHSSSVEYCETSITVVTLTGIGLQLSVGTGTPRDRRRMCISICRLTRWFFT